MQRKPTFPVANCSIKMPDCSVANPVMPESQLCEEDSEQQQRRQQLINFGHSQWGFNNWSWAVTKQDLDFVDLVNGKYCAGVVAFVSVWVKNLDIRRENIGYATSIGTTKGFAIYKSRKCAVTNALRETLLSFGGSVATDLTELLETQRPEFHTPAAPVPPEPENNQNIANRPAEPKNSPLNRRKEPELANPVNIRPAPKNAAPVAKAHPIPANMPRPTLGPRPASAPRPNSNEPPKSLESMTEEEARAERKRRQRLAQEEFRQKQMLKQDTGPEERQELSKNSTSLDRLLMDIPTQEIEIEASGVKRASPTPAAAGDCKRRGNANSSKLDIVQAE